MSEGGVVIVNLFRTLQLWVVYLLEYKTLAKLDMIKNIEFRTKNTYALVTRRNTYGYTYT